MQGIIVLCACHLTGFRIRYVGGRYWVTRAIFGMCLSSLKLRGVASSVRDLGDEFVSSQNLGCG